ncbi:TetR/AcrR family transcriptional regulator [Nesterenkonia populi]|uniref:TetR/AcrR family transcriptional regulator n=1 Tax=Nesterenkonia populi TaxID=1591087 RepID=UPI0011BF5578|nr:TetR family transcriptional regulator [Nesterenkonia populi]
MAYRYGCTRGPEDASASRPDARERIQQAAIELYGEHGFEATSLKAIAERAEVSAPLVLHHFGSKAGLRTACDQRAAEHLRQAKLEAVRRQGSLPQNYLFEVMSQNLPLVRYMLRAFAAGGRGADALMDQLVEDSLEYTAEAEALGQVVSSRNPEHRAALLLMMSFGSMMMHHQMKRLLGVSPVEDPPEEWGPYIAAVSEIYLYGVLRPEAYPDLVAFIDDHRKGRDR